MYFIIRISSKYKKRFNIYSVLGALACECSLECSRPNALMLFPTETGVIENGEIKTRYQYSRTIPTAQCRKKQIPVICSNLL